MLLTQLVHNDYVSLQEALSFQITPYKLYFLEYLFAERDPETVVDDLLFKIVTYLRCVAQVSEMKTRELVRLTIERFGCEKVFDYGKGSTNRYNPPWILFLENTIINTCNKNLPEYDTSKLVQLGSWDRLSYLIVTRVDNV